MNKSYLGNYIVQTVWAEARMAPREDNHDLRCFTCRIYVTLCKDYDSSKEKTFLSDKRGGVSVKYNMLEDDL